MKKNKIVLASMCALPVCSSIPLFSLVSCESVKLTAIPKDALKIGEDGVLAGIDTTKVNLAMCNELIIPDNVYGIDNAAFAGVFAKSKNCNVKKISFSPKINRIGAAAFAGCDSINSLDFSRMSLSNFENLDLNSRQQAFIGMPESLIGDIIFPSSTRPDDDSIKFITFHKLFVEGGLSAFWMKPELGYTKLSAPIITIGEQMYPYDNIYTPLSEEDLWEIGEANYADEYLNTYVRRFPSIFIDDLMWTYSRIEEREILWPGEKINYNWLEVSNVEVKDEENYGPGCSKYNLSFDIHFQITFEHSPSYYDMDYTINYRNMQISLGGPWGWGWPTLCFDWLAWEGQKKGSWEVVIQNNLTGQKEWDLKELDDVQNFYNSDSKLYNFILDDGDGQSGRNGAYIRPHFFINKNLAG